MDLIEMDAASNTGVDDVRDLRDKIGFSPSQGQFKVYIVDEAHMLSTQAFNALLKTLEEPPPHAIFVLATTEIHKIPATVLSRCQRHEFRRVAVQEIVDNLRRIVREEGLTAEDEALMLIARQATGSIRDAQSLLDQLASVGPTISLALAQAVLGTATSQSVFGVIDSIRDNRAGAGLETIRRALDSGTDPRTLARQIVDYLRSLMLIQLGNENEVEAPKETKERMRGHADAFATSEVVRLMKVFNSAAAETRAGWQPSLPLELALAEAFEAPSAQVTSPSSLGSGSAPGRQGGDGQPPAGSRQRASIAKASPAAGGEPSAQPGAARQIAEYPPAYGGGEAREESKGNPEPKAGGVTLAEVSKAWRQVRAVIKPAHPAVEALLNSCKPVEMRGDELLLGFQSDTVRALMDKPENLEAARQAIAEVVGTIVRIRCVVTNARGQVPPNLLQDGMVATAINHGGEIVDVQD
jgi:DNA polymerase-3 subunit gamma/tau